MNESYETVMRLSQKHYRVERPIDGGSSVEEIPLDSGSSVEEMATTSGGRNSLAPVGSDRILRGSKRARSPSPSTHNIGSQEEEILATDMASHEKILSSQSANYEGQEDALDGPVVSPEIQDSQVSSPTEQQETAATSSVVSATIQDSQDPSPTESTSSKQQETEVTTSSAASTTAQDSQDPSPTEPTSSEGSRYSLRKTNLREKNSAGARPLNRVNYNKVIMSGTARCSTIYH